MRHDGARASKYFGLKLGDILHSGPLLVGNPNDFALFVTNARNGTIQAFSQHLRNRRRVLFVGANDGLLHAFDAGDWDRTPSGLPTAARHCYDLGTGAELFAFAPRAIMQIYKPLKDAVGAQTKQDEWTVDLSPSAADVFIDTGHSGTPVPANRAWHTVLVGGVREGSPFEGTERGLAATLRAATSRSTSRSPTNLPAPAAVEANGTLRGSQVPERRRGDAGACARDWPAVLWEITDTDGRSTPGSRLLPTWARPGPSRRWDGCKVCTANCGTSSAPRQRRPLRGDLRRRVRPRAFQSACAPACNRRGNWLYMVDVETGFALYKVNSGAASIRLRQLHASSSAPSPPSPRRWTTTATATST